MLAKRNIDSVKQDILQESSTESTRVHMARFTYLMYIDRLVIGALWLNGVKAGGG